MKAKFYDFLVSFKDSENNDKKSTRVIKITYSDVLKLEPNFWNLVKYMTISTQNATIEFISRYIIIDDVVNKQINLILML